MPAYTLVGRSLVIASVAIVLFVPAAFAGRVGCRDVDAALESGLTPEQASVELDTTATRVEACQRIALQRARNEERRAEQHERHAERQLLRD
jgi:hypothetical protein